MSLAAFCCGNKTWKCTCSCEKSYNTDFICLSPWKYLSEMRNYLYDCFGDWSWRELGCIYVWASGGKTLCSVEINHFTPAPALRPPDWLSPRQGCHAAIVGLNLRISSANLTLGAWPLAVHSSSFFSSSWTGSLGQLQFVFPCLRVFWGLSKTPVTLVVLEQTH